MSYEIRVYCEGQPLRGTLEPSHAGKRAHVARLEWVAAGETNRWDGGGVPAGIDMWVPHPISRRRQRKLSAERGVAAPDPEVVQDIGADGKPVDLHALATRGPGFPADFHVKFVLRCDVCGLDYQFRTETISPLLDDMRRAGWSEVSLPALGATLRK